MATTVLIADDHDIIREGIKSVLKSHLDYKVVSEAKDGEEVLGKVTEFTPDVLLLDITMPKISGLDIIDRVHRYSPNTKIIIITVHKMGAYVIRALQSGIKGYINKDSVVEELIPALLRVQTGGVYLGSQISHYIAQTIGQTGQASPKSGEVLNKREHDVLRLTAEGKTAKETAQILFLSRRTVENYKNAILKKLNLHKTSDLIKYAMENKIVDTNNGT